VFTQVLTIEGKPERVEDGVRYFWGQVIPAAEKLNGFEEGYIMVNRKTGKLVSIITWKTQKDLEAVSDTTDQQLSNIVGATKKPVYETYEVATAKRILI
jgi:hypothetical protein